MENRTGKLFVYRVVESTIVDPDETWVIGPDPIDTDAPLLTMTTCHPKLSDRQRLVVWASLDEDRTAATAE